MFVSNSFIKVRVNAVLNRRTLHGVNDRFVIGMWFVIVETQINKNVSILSHFVITCIVMKSVENKFFLISSLITRNDHLENGCNWPPQRQSYGTEN